MRPLLTTLSELAATDSTNAKKAILKRSWGADLRLVITAALDPYRMYYVRKLPPPRMTLAKSLLPWRDVERVLLRPLHERSITGRRAIDKVVTVMEQLSPEDGEILQRILRKDLRCGVGSKLVNAVYPGLIPEFKVQLARSSLERAVFPCYMEPKFDGLRTLAFVGDDGTTFMSRGGHPLQTLDHIGTMISSSFAPGTVLDGETWTAGGFQESMSAIKRDKENSFFDAPIKYTVWDMLTAEEFATRRCSRPYIERRGQLERHWDLRNGVMFDHDILLLAEKEIVRSLNDARAKFQSYRDAEYEGIILKDPDGTYDFKRSAAWIKMKPEDTEDLEITGTIEGRGKYVGQLGALVVSRGKQECHVGGGFSDEQRVSMWRSRAKLVGKVAEVLFTESTDDGKMRHPRFIRIREDKS